MWFLAPLCAAVSAAVVYEKCERSSAEIAIICVAVVLASVVLTIIFAPWPIKLVLAILLFASRFMRAEALNS